MRPISIAERLLADGAHATLDLLIGGLGYEHRSREIPAMFREAGVPTTLLDLASAGSGSYDENRRIALASGSEILEKAPSELDGWFVGVVEELLASGRVHPHLGIDVSSITRDRIAWIIEGIRRIEAAGVLGEHATLRVDFLYTPSKPFDPLPGPERIEVSGPVTPGFAGFAADPDSPVVAFVGLGVEEDRAIGALEYIEPATTWAFVPGGEDPDFDERSKAANDWVWRTVPTDQIVPYAVADPFSLIVDLEQLVASEAVSGRPILVPLGPKIFAVCCLLVAVLHRRAGVWRVSPGGYGGQLDCESAGKLVALGVQVGAD
jgi:hypothetical protein